MTVLNIYGVRVKDADDHSALENTIELIEMLALISAARNSGRTASFHSRSARPWFTRKTPPNEHP